MALNNITMSAQEMEGDNGKKVVVTIYADNVDWLNVVIGDDAELGAQVMDVVIEAIEGPQAPIAG